MPKAMILAAGFGTRLAPLSQELPKPLVWVGDRPAIAHIAERLVAAGIGDIVVNTHHRADAFSPEVLARIPGRLSVVTEAEILGTGGGLANAAALLGDGEVVVWNGDILAPLDVGALWRAHVSAGEGKSRCPPPATCSPAAQAARVSAPPKSAAPRPQGGEPVVALGDPEQSIGGRLAATLAIAPRPRGQGTVGVGASGEVVRLRGQTFGEEVSGGDFLGISVIGEELRRALPIPGCLVGEGLLPWLQGGGRIGTFAAELAWEDIGSVSSYLHANARWLADTGRSSYVGPGAEVSARVEISGSVVGEGAVVEGEGRVEGCVIWPGAKATAPLAKTVVTTKGLVVKG